jgi:CRP/FNR family transcriptional regulator, cyclic AMP receptor protein
MASLIDTSDEMRANSWFSSLPENEQRMLIESSDFARLKPGEYLHRRGDLPDGFYGLNCGRLKISTIRADGKEGILAVLEAGNWFGQCSMIDRGPRVHDVIALTPVSTFLVRPPAFEALMQNPVFVRAVAVLQSMHLNWLYRVIEDATLHSTRTRIARRLLLLTSSDTAAVTPNRRKIALSRDTLAMMLGISRQTLASELKPLAESGAIALKYGCIEIRSEAMLSAFE